jgi:hypothetical protein
MEWGINANAEPTECEELGIGMKCHRGLFRVAKNMEPLVASQLGKSLANDTTDEVYVLFTGHSSGAAIAQILFALMHSRTSLLSSFRQSE